jgi:hypothetical protein
MEDVAGVRVVDTSGSMSRYDQDSVCERILGALGSDCLVRRNDRRADPRAGYQAVHLVAGRMCSLRYRYARPCKTHGPRCLKDLRIRGAARSVMDSQCQTPMRRP